MDVNTFILHKILGLHKYELIHSIHRVMYFYGEADGKRIPNSDHDSHTRYLISCKICGKRKEGRLDMHLEPNQVRAALHCE